MRSTHHIPDVGRSVGPALPGGSSSARGSVLVIDDEPGIRLVTQGMLECMGFGVLTAGDACQGLQVLTQHADEVCAVLLDLTLPGPSGKPVIEQLRQVRPGVPVVLCSGYGQAELAQRFADCRLAGYLQKPFTYDDLAIALRTALAR